MQYIQVVKLVLLNSYHIIVFLFVPNFFFLKLRTKLFVENLGNSSRMS